MHHEAALESGRYAAYAAEGDEEQAHLPAVAVSVVDHIFGYVVDGGVFARRGPRIVFADVSEDPFGLLRGCGGIAYDACGKGAQPRREAYVTLALGCVLAVYGRRGVVRERLD